MTDPDLVVLMSTAKRLIVANHELCELAGAFGESEEYASEQPDASGERQEQSVSSS